MLLHSLALLLTWSAVALGCDGKPELAVTYSVWTESIVKTGTAFYPDGNVHNTERRDFMIYGTGLTSLTLPDPAEGGGVFWQEPVSVDAAGNRSDQPGGCAP